MKFFKEFEKIPNLITLYRLLMIPFLLYFSFIQNKIIFIILFLISGLTDLFDGFIARKLNQTSNFGAIFDNFVDEIIHFFTIIFLYFMYPEIIFSYLFPLLSVLLIYLINRSLIFFKFKNKSRFHLFSGKFTVFFHYVSISLFLLLEIRWLVLIDLVLHIIELMEEIGIMLIYKDINPDIKSIFLYSSK
jgi:CDP-diacylglycerol--glycerol-3-phosphate 3-phosphatidyltransferase